MIFTALQLYSFHLSSRKKRTELFTAEKVT